MYLLFYFLHELALFLDELLVLHHVQLLWLHVIFDETVFHLLPLVALEKFVALYWETVTYHMDYIYLITKDGSQIKGYCYGWGSLVFL